MIKEQLEDRGVKNKQVLNAMKKVPRHLFVPAKMTERAYEDNALPIDFEQTISQPYIVGYMSEAIEPDKNDKVLEIGTGSGYQAAVLAEIVKEVYSVEIIEGLATQARERLKDLGYKNVHVKVGDGHEGWPEKGPYDSIIVTAAAGGIPEPLIEQLKEGGRMIIPVGPRGGLQHLMVLRKEGGEIIKKKTIGVKFVPFTRKG